jgi:hypothetical protein
MLRSEELGKEVLKIGFALCWYCGVRVAATRDHFRPRRLGGGGSFGNVVPCCARCNSAKGSDLIFAFASRMIARFYDAPAEKSAVAARRRRRFIEHQNIQVLPRNPFALLNIHKKCPACGAVTQQVHRWNDKLKRSEVFEVCSKLPREEGHGFQIF